MISIRRVAWDRVTTPDYAADTHTHIHKVDCHRLHLCPSLEKGKDVKLQGVTCTKLSTFLNVNKQLGVEEEKDGGGEKSMIEEEKDAWRKELGQQVEKRERLWLKGTGEVNEGHEEKVCGAEEEQDS